MKDDQIWPRRIFLIVSLLGTTVYVLYPRLAYKLGERFIRILRIAHLFIIRCKRHLGRVFDFEDGYKKMLPLDAGIGCATTWLVRGYGRIRHHSILQVRMFVLPMSLVTQFFT